MQNVFKKRMLFGREWDIWQILTGILLFIYISIVFITFTEYGITIDEPPQATYGQEIVKWYLSGFQYDEFFTRVKILDLERYGGFFDTLLYPITQLSPLDTYETRHLCYALLGLFGIMGVYLLGATIGSNATGFLASLLLLLTPRFYGHMFNNPKDLPFAIFYIWSVYFITRCLQQVPDLSRHLIWATGLAIGLTLGTRVGGLILFGYLGLFFALRYIQLGMFTTYSPDAIKRALFQMGSIALIAWITMLLFWPSALRSPIVFPIDALLNFSQYGTPDFTTTFFEGKHIDINEVPWYYAPMWFLLALPEFLYLGLVLCAFFLVHKLKQHKTIALTKINLKWGLLGFAAFFPLIYVVLIGTPLYDGLRHFLFIVPPLTVLSAAGIEMALRITPTNWMRQSLFGLLFILLSVTLWDMIRLHPNQVVYFNRIFAGGLQKAAQQYQTDYWENSHKQGVQWLDAYYEKHRPNQKLRISAGGSNLQYALNLNRYVFTNIPVEADFYFSITRDDRHKMVPGEIVHTIERDGVALLYIIRPDSTYNNDPFFAKSEDRDIHLAWKYLQANAYDKSLAVYQNILKNDPQNPMIYHNVANAHYRLGHYQEATHFSRLALQSKPDYLKACIFLGHALLAQGETEAAVQTYREVLQTKTSDAEVHHGLAKGLQKLGQTEAAVQAYQTALQHQSNDAIIYRNFGAYLAEQGQYSKAEAMLQKAASLDTTQAVIWYMLAQTNRLNEHIEKARQHILKAIALNQSNTNYRQEHLNLGRIYEQKGDTKNMRALYEEAIRLTPHNPEAYIQLGVSHFKHNQHTEAASVFERALQTIPNDPRMHMGLAQALEHLGQIEQAIQAYRNVLSLMDSPEVRTHLNTLLARKN